MLGEELSYKADGPNQRFVPNPRYRGALPAEDVETRQRRLTMVEAEEHFLPASRGIDIGSSGWYFTGRERLLIELVKWLKTAENGIVVVTGPAGSGKSAVMGRLAILSDPHYRKFAESEHALLEVSIKTLPPEGIIDVSVHAKGKTLADCIGSIAAALDITLSEHDRNNSLAIIEAVEKKKKHVTILLDALDEAKPGHHYPIGKRLLKPLSLLSQVRVLVGTRRNPDGATISESEPRHARLRGLFGEDVCILDLEDEPQIEEDIGEYVRKRLMDSRHRNDQAKIGRVSKAVADQAAGIFLYARVVARTLEEVENLDEELPKDALDAFVVDLTRRFGDRAEMVDELLCALAWCEGKGLSRRVWVSVASALSKAGAQYTDGDVSWVLNHAGWHIIEAGEEGQAVYRLPHQAMADYYRNRFEELDANFQITRALTEEIAGKGWLNADPYLWRHLASHAATADLLEYLVADPGYLAVADPAKLVPVLSKLGDSKAKDIVNLYRRIANQLYPADHLERMAIIHLAAKQEHPALSDAVEPPVAPAWRCQWASWQTSNPYFAITENVGLVNSVALGEVDGSPVVISGSMDGTVRLWDARSGRALGEPLTGHEDRISSVPVAPGQGVASVALGEVDGSPVVVSGSQDKKVRLWDARSGRALGKPLTGHKSTVTSVALGKVDGSPVVISGSWDGTVRLWDARSGHALGEPLSDHGDRVSSVSEAFDEQVLSVALGEVDELPVVVSGSRDGTVRLWDARSGRALGEPLTGHKVRVYSVVFDKAVSSVALGEVDGSPVVVSGSVDKKVRLWDARSGRALVEPLTGHKGGVSSVALGEVDGSPVVVSGSHDKTVRLWDARSGRELGEPLTGHDIGVSSVALSEVDGSPVVVSGSHDKTIRLWDARSGRALGEPFAGHKSSLESVALGEVDGSPAVVSGSEDKAVRLWDAQSGRALGEPLTGHKGRVSSVGLGEVDGSPVVVSGSHDKMVRLWDARSGRALGEPLTGHKDWVTSVALGEVDGSPVVVSGSHDKTVRLWDARSGRALGEPLSGHKDRVTSAALGEVDGSPVVVSGSWDRTVRLWDAHSCRALGEPLTGHEGVVFTVALGEVAGLPVVVSGSGDKTVRLWDARTGRKSKLVIPIRSRAIGLVFAGHSTIVVGTIRGLLSINITRISSQ